MVAKPGDYGASNSGLVDATPELQAALDSGTAVVRCEPGDIYLLSVQGTKTIEGSAFRYCLSVPSGVTLDLNGATLKLADAQNGCLLVNANAGTSADRDIAIVGGRLDGNKTNQTEPASGSQNLVLLYDVDRPVVERITANAVRYCAGRFLKVREGSFDDLVCEDSAGDGWFFGLSANDQHVVDCSIGRVVANNCVGGAGNGRSGNPVAQGNPAFVVARNTTIASLEASGCGAGHKIADATEGLAVGQVRVSGSTGTNSGMKVQGNDGAGLFPTNITIGQVVATDNAGSGLYLQSCVDVQVGQFMGADNASLGSTPDVWVAGTRSTVGSIQSVGSGQVGVQVRVDAQDYRIGTCRVRNPFGSAVSVNGGRGRIDSLFALDDRATPKMSRGLDVNGAASVMTVGSLDSTGHTIDAFRAVAGATVTITTTEPTR